MLEQGKGLRATLTSCGHCGLDWGIRTTQSQASPQWRQCSRRSNFSLHHQQEEQWCNSLPHASLCRADKASLKNSHRRFNGLITLGSLAFVATVSKQVQPSPAAADFLRSSVPCIAGNNNEAAVGREGEWKAKRETTEAAQLFSSYNEGKTRKGSTKQSENPHRWKKGCFCHYDLWQSPVSLPQISCLLRASYYYYFASVQSQPSKTGA